MKNNKKVTHAKKIGVGTDSEIPENFRPLEFIQKVTKLLDEWAQQDKERGFVLIATSECYDDDGCGLASGCDGNDEVLAKMMCGALEHDKNLQKIVIDACRLRE